MKTSIKDLKDSVLAIESYAKLQVESFGSLTLKTGDEQVAKEMFQAMSRLQVASQLQMFVGGLDESTNQAEALLRTQERLHDMACGGHTENSLFGEAFAAERRKYASQLLRSWFL